MSCKAHCHVCCFAEQRLCSKVGIGAETNRAIVCHSLNSFPALEVLAGLVEGVVGVGWGDGGMGSRVAISRENYKRRVFSYLNGLFTHDLDTC